MSLDKLTKKPVLKETIPSVLSPEISTQSSQKQVVTIPEKTSTEDILQSVNNELSSWKDYYKQVNSQTQSLVLTTSSSSVITAKDLSDWFLTGNTKFPATQEEWEDYYWKQPSSFFPLIQNICDTVIQDLENCADTLSNQLFSGNYPKIEVAKVETTRVTQAASLRAQLQAVEASTKKKLAECFIRRTIATLVAGTSTKGFSSPVITSNNLNDIAETVRNIRRALRYATLSKYVDWKKTKKNIENRFMQLAVQALLQEAASIVGQLYSSITTPVTNFISDFQQLSGTEFCGAFDEGISILIDQVEGLESKYINYVYQYEQQVISKYSFNSQLIELVGQKSKLDKQVELMDRILQTIETLSSTGNLEEVILSKVMKSPRSGVVLT